MKKISELNIGDTFTAENSYTTGETKVFTVLGKIDECCLCVDNKGWHQTIEPDTEVYPIRFSSLDGQAYRP